LATPIGVDLERIYVSSPFGVAALDQETGVAIWEEEPSTGIAGLSFVIVGDVIAVARGNTLVGLEAETGQQLWVHEATTSVETLTASEPGGLFTTDGERVFSYDSQNGSIIWDVPTDPGGLIVLEAAIGLVCTERLVSPPADARLTCYDQSNGMFRWARFLHSPPWIALTPTDVIVAGLELDEGPGLMGLDRNSGQASWKRPGLSGNSPAVSYEDDVLYTCAEGCTAVSGDEGEILWHTDLEKPVGAPSQSGTTIGVVAFLSEPNPLYVLDATTGILRAAVLPDLSEDSGGFCGTPAIDGNLIFVFTCGGTLYAYRISSL
jgi:outer membrane protein assembly factor BamB